ncbi:hypothetical protein BH10PSE15_BH10PSE15_01040 [soil metagenome]
MAPARFGAGLMADSGKTWDVPPLGGRFAALARVFADTKLTHREPAFGVDRVQSGNQLLDVREDVVLSLPFCDLVHFAKDDLEPRPKVLLVVPLSGHFATLLRNTVETLLRDHDVYITDWRNARDVPVSDGAFGFDD